MNTHTPSCFQHTAHRVFFLSLSLSPFICLEPLANGVHGGTLRFDRTRCTLAMNFRANVRARFSLVNVAPPPPSAITLQCFVPSLFLRDTAMQKWGYVCTCEYVCVIFSWDKSGTLFRTGSFRPFVNSQVHRFPAKCKRNNRAILIFFPSCLSQWRCRLGIYLVSGKLYFLFFYFFARIHIDPIHILLSAVWLFFVCRETLNGTPIQLMVNCCTWSKVCACLNRL